MKAIRAGQLIFTQVSDLESPRGLSGWQTLYCSRRNGRLSKDEPALCLEPDEVLELEKRLVYSASPGCPVKHLYFRLLRAKAVLARIVPRPEEADKDRRGVFFAHVLVLPFEEFRESLGNNPFAVFDGFPFRERLADLDSATLDWATQDISPVTIKPGKPGVIAPPRLCDDFEHLAAILRLSAQAHSLLRKEEAIALLGSPADTFAFLRDLFACLPVELRQWCSFDTLFSGGSLGITPYWAIGLPAGEMCPDMAFPFDLAKRRFQIPVNRAPDSAYQRWMEHVIQRDRRVDRVFRKGQSSYRHSERYDRLFENKDGLPKEERCASKWDGEYAALYKDALGEQLKQLLLAQVGETLTKEYHERILAMQQTPKGASELLAALETDSCVGLLAQLLHEEHAKIPRKWPKGAVLAPLRKLADQWTLDQGSTQNFQVGLMCLRWAEDWGKLRTRLERARKEHLVWFLRWGLFSMVCAVQWCIYHFEHGLAFGPRVQPKNTPEDGPLLDLLLGASGKLDHPGSPAPHTINPFPFGPERRPWLIQLLAHHQQKDYDALATWRKPGYPRFWDELLKNGNMCQLRAELRNTKEPKVQAFAAESLQKHMPAWNWPPKMEWCIRHESNAVFFGPFLWLAKIQERAFMLALLNVPDGYKSSDCASWWWDWVRDLFSNSGNRLPVPCDASLEPGVAEARWPLIVNCLERCTKKVPSPGASNAVVL